MEGRASNSWSWSHGGKEDSTHRFREISEREVCSEALVAAEDADVSERGGGGSGDVGVGGAGADLVD